MSQWPRVTSEPDPAAGAGAPSGWTTPRFTRAAVDVIKFCAWPNLGDGVASRHPYGYRDKVARVFLVPLCPTRVFGTRSTFFWGNISNIFQFFTVRRPPIISHCALGQLFQVGRRVCFQTPIICIGCNSCLCVARVFLVPLCPTRVFLGAVYIIFKGKFRIY